MDGIRMSGLGVPEKPILDRPAVQYVFRPIPVQSEHHRLSVHLFGQNSAHEDACPLPEHVLLPSSFGRIEPALLRDSIGIRIIPFGFKSINVIYGTYTALPQRTALRMTLGSLILN